MPLYPRHAVRLPLSPFSTSTKNLFSTVYQGTKAACSSHSHHHHHQSTNDRTLLPRKMKRAMVRVASYNVLSSSLCSPSYFVNSEEKFCSSKYRLDGLLSKLRGEMNQNSILCLQEVSLAWTGKLYSFFEANDYAFVVSNYGGRFNG